MLSYIGFFVNIALFFYKLFIFISKKRSAEWLTVFMCYFLLLLLLMRTFVTVLFRNISKQWVRRRFAYFSSG